MLNEGVVSKETVVLRRWGSSIQKFGFINGVDNVNWRFERIGFEGLTLETSAFRISVRWPIYIINSVDKTKFLYFVEEAINNGLFHRLGSALSSHFTTPCTSKMAGLSLEIEIEATFTSVWYTIKTSFLLRMPFLVSR